TRRAGLRSGYLGARGFYSPRSRQRKRLSFFPFGCRSLSVCGALRDFRMARRGRQRRRKGRSFFRNAGGFLGHADRSFRLFDRLDRRAAPARSLARRAVEETGRMILPAEHAEYTEKEFLEIFRVFPRVPRAKLSYLAGIMRGSVLGFNSNSF